MRQISIREFDQAQPAVVIGCMRQAGFTDNPFTPQQMNHFIQTAADNGATYFDHADIYGLGRAEQVFGDALAMSPGLRDRLVIQSKCGIANGYYDSSRDHILEAVDGILSRLQTDYLDVLLLHRPDALIEPEEVAEAFSRLKESGKVRRFGVSNYTPGQIRLLESAVREPLIINQMECSVVHAGMIAQGIEANMTTPGSVDHDGGILDFCRLKDITIQAWSPFQISLHEGTFLGSEDYPALNEELDRLAEIHGTNPAGIALAWLLRHPAHMQVIVGTAREERMVQLIEASEIRLSREEWYALYKAAGHPIP